MKKLLLLFTLAFLVSFTFLSAQGINEYTYGTSTDGTLEDMSGSTPLLAVNTYYDDTASSVTSIGFTFAFGLGAYTQFSANSNGQMQLGATAISGGSASPAANTPRLAPISGDNAIRATGKLHYKLFGASPNQKLVVEWLDLRVNYSSATETGTYCRLQAWLYEGSNNIKFVYGQMYNMSTSAQTRGVYISTSNVAGTVGNWETITATPTWTVTGTSVVTTSFPASSYMTNLDSSADGSRRVFSMNYPVYTNPPNPAVLVSPINGGWAFTNATLTWISGGGGATSYDVYFGTSPTPPFVVNQGATSYTPTLAAGMTYYWNIVARNANGAAAATETWSFKTPTTTQLAESFESAWPPLGWANTGSWSRGSTYKYHGTYGAYKAGSTSSSYVLSGPKVTITPTSALDFWAAGSSTSTAILQVIYSPDRVTWQQIGSSITYPATYTFYHQVVDLSSLAGNDYYIGFRNGAGAGSNYVDYVFGPELTAEVPGPAGPTAPADLAINVNPFTTFTWTAPTTGGVATGYKIYCDGNTDPTSLVATITNPATLTYTLTTALNYNMLYYWKVVAYNGTGDSVGNTVRSFTTWPDPTVSVFPWTESFDGTTFAPLGWSNTAIVGTYIWDRQTSGTNPTCTPYSGAGMARYNSYSSSSGNKAELATPPLAVPDSQAYRVRFWMFRDSGYSTYSNEVVNVYLNTSPSSTGGTLLGTISRYYGFAPVEAVANAWYQYTFIFTGSAADKHIIFEAVSQFGNNMFIDHVQVEPVPSDPIFVVTPPELTWDFGAVTINSARTKQYTVTNNGGGTITLNSVTASGTYYSISVPPSDLSLEADESTTFTVQYLPTVVGGPYAGSVTISYTASTRTDYVINFTGTCFDPRVTLPYNENFDGAAPPLVIAPAASWVIGAPAKTYLNAAYSAPNALVTRSLSAVYNDNENSTVTLQVNTDPLETDVIVEFKQKFVTETGWDGMVFEYSIDNMATWIKWDATVGTGANFDTAISQFWYNNTSTSGPITPPKWSGSNSGSLYGDDVNGWLPTHTVIPYSLFGTAGNLALRWHFGSDSSGTYEGFAIDDISIRQSVQEAPGLVTLVAPADGATNVNFFTASLSWNPSATGGIPTNYEGWLSTDPDAATDPNTLFAGTWFQSTTPSIAMAAIPGQSWAYSTTYYWGILPSNTWGSPDFEDPAFQIFSFTTVADPAIVSLPHSQNFDGVTAPAFPLGWTAYKSNSSSSFYTSTSYSQTAPNAVYMYAYTTTETMRLISPQVLVPMNSFKLSFYLRAGGTPYTMKVGTVSALDGTGVFTEVASITPTTSGVFTPYTVSFANYTGTDQYICFQHGVTSTYQSFYLDNVLLEELMANDMAATAITGIPLGIAGTSMEFDITVYNSGTATQNAYNVHLKKHGDDRLASLPVNTPLDPGAYATHTITWTPTTADIGTFNVVGEVELTGDGNAANNESALMALYIYPAGTFVPQIGDIASTTTTNQIPFDLFYKNNVCETIYLPHELQMTSGTINAIIYQNNFTQDLTKPVKIWMKHTTASDVSTSWLDFTGYQLVFEGDVHFPLGVNAVIIPLTTPFVYTGGNLAVRDYRVWENVYWNSTNYFYYTPSPEYPNRTRHYYADDSGPIDPVLMLTYGGSAIAGNLVNWIPNTALIVSPATPITALAAPVVTSSVVGANCQLDWPVVAGAYSYRVYASNDPYTWPDTPLTTVHTNTYSFAVDTVPYQFFKVVAITTYRETDLGLVLNPAAAVGFDNSRVKAEPAIGKTDNKD